MFNCGIYLCIVDSLVCIILGENGFIVVIYVLMGLLIQCIVVVLFIVELYSLVCIFSIMLLISLLCGYNGDN